MSTVTSPTAPNSSPGERSGPRVAADDLTIRPLRHTWRWISGAAVLFLVAIFIHAIATNKKLDFAAIGQYLFSQDPLGPRPHHRADRPRHGHLDRARDPDCGDADEQEPCHAGGVGGLHLGIPWNAAARTGRALGYLGLLFDRLGIGVPFTSIMFWSMPTNLLVTPFVAGLLALTLNQAAYSAEIVRSGMLSVDSGQREAAASLGMTPVRTFRRIRCRRRCGSSFRRWATSSSRC